MSTITVLLLDPEHTVSESVRNGVGLPKGCQLEVWTDADAAVDRCADGDVAVLLVFLETGPRVEWGVELLHRVAKWQSPLPIIFLCGADDAELRLRLIQQGALDCLCRPLDLSRLSFLIDILTVRWIQGASLRQPSSARREDLCVGDYYFEASGMRQLLERVRAVAPLETTVLITGETGTGKTHLARAIHELSPRREKPFMVVHCGALAPTLLESELFGHVRGAFTHAERDYRGRFSEVGDGTLFLDEVDCLPLECQARLLRALEERVFEPVGSTKSERLRARFLAAANRPLEDEVSAKRFRSDLYYRLNVVSLQLTPLRERKQLVEPLVKKFLAEFRERSDRDIRGLSDNAMRLMMAYDWPGNVRELRNVLEGAVAFCHSQRIDVEHLPDSILKAGLKTAEASVAEEPVTENQLAKARDAAEKQRLLDALALHGNNRSDAAAELGISRVTLYKKLHRFGLS